MPLFQPLAAIASKSPLPTWLWNQVLHGRLGPVLAEFAKNPQATAQTAFQRIGDTLVWKTGEGTKVIAHLESLADSQARIEQAVTTIGSAQVAMTSSLHVLQSLSMLTLGVTSFTGALMLWRLQALKKRHDALEQSIQDIEGQLKSMQRAHLQTAINFLDTYERQHGAKELHLDKALEEARQAAHNYKNLASDEADRRDPRIEVLNYRGRMYLLAFITELRCCALANDLETVECRIKEDEPILGAVAKATFARTIGAAPEEYLHTDFREYGVTLDLMAEVYSQAHEAGAVTGSEILCANEMFEQLRDRLTGWRPSLPRFSRRQWREDMMKKFQYAVCCLEETNRVRSLKLLLEEAKRTGWSFQDLNDKVTAWKQEAAGAVAGSDLLAFRLA